MQLELQFSFAQPKRLFIPERAPLLAVAEWLLQQAPAHERVLDVQKHIVVLPTARSGRRLLEALVAGAEKRQRGLLPPRIMTPGALYSLLGTSAPAALVRLAWLETLQAQAADCRAAFGSECKSQQEALELAALCEGMDRELMGAGHTFAALSGERYQALERLRQGCVVRLAGADPRSTLLDGMFPNAPLVLVGIVDLPPALRNKLHAANTTVISLAPEQWQQRFDEWGGLHKAPWLAARIDIDDRALHFVDSAREQADAVVEFLAGAGSLSTRDVSIALLDDEVTSPLEHALSRAGADAHVALPLQFTAQPAARLLQAAADLLESDDIETFATFVRHPDVGSTDALAQLDRYREEHLPERPAFLGDDKAAAFCRELAERVQQLLGGLRGEARALGAWDDEVMAFLSRVYGARKLSTSIPDDKRLLDTLNAVLATVDALQPASLQCSAAQGLRFILSACDGEVVARDARADALELMGWLELPFDDAEVTVAVGCNEGKLPPSLNADAFLPNSVRRELGLIDNDQRYARDAYVLSILLRTRQKLLLVAGRRSLVGDPLLPSRLLLACDGRLIAQRIKRFFTDTAKPVSDDVGARFIVPEPDPRDDAPHELPVTAFAEYLQCPYRFYLKRVLRLREVDDTAREMTPRVSGTLVHAALNAFGSGPHAHESEARHLKSALRDALWHEARRRFGAQPSMAIVAQLGQLEQRLNGLALWQARQRDAGWRIAHCELKLAEPFLVDEVATILTGTIDRVDEHPELGVVIYDYKTSENALDPERKHLHNGAWVDLQLPLYLHLWRSRGDKRSAQLGFISIAKNPRDTRGRVARWSEQDLQPAYEVARTIVRDVRKRVFWPMNPRVEFDDFPWICQ